MSEFVIEAILVAMIVVPLIASSPEPARVVSRNGSALCRKLRRTHKNHLSAFSRQPRLR
jgi:hypothetical protein